MSEQEWLSIAEAAAVWRVSKITVHRWIKQGRVQAYHVGPRRVRLRAEDVNALPVAIQKDPRAEEGEMLIDAGDALVTTELALPGMTDEQFDEGREALRRIDEMAARIRARSGLHESAAILMRQAQEERDKYLWEVAQESNEEIRRRRELGGR